MRRKITAMIMALVFSMGVMPVTQAALSDKIDELETALGVADLTDQTVEVPTDISVRKNGETTYVNGPLEITGTSATVDFKAEIDMTNVLAEVANYKTIAQGFIDAETDPAAKQDLIDELASACVDDNIANSYFDITIDYPNSNFTIPDSFKNATDLSIFSSSKPHTNIFEVKDPATYITDDGDKLVIKVGVKSGVTLAVLEANLAELVLECTGIQIGATGTYTVKGTVTGKTTIKTDASASLGVVTYNFVQKDGGQDPETVSDISATVKLSTSSPSGPSGSGATKRALTVVMDNGNVATFRFDKGKVVSLSGLEIEIPHGKKAEFYLDEQFTKVAGPNVKLDQDTTIYVKFVDKDDVEIPLEKDDHFAYVIGYPDGNVRPENNITREEIATIFYRLLNDDVRDELFTAENDFTDVKADRWSNKAISTMANGGYIVGYKDGTFKPAAPITRAEFVTIVARFYNVDENTGVKIGDFVDTQGHWAGAYIRYSSSNGIVDGYDDGTFKPDQNITRAEAMKVINTMLDRIVDEEGLVEEANRWPDNSPDKWYYYHVIEATNPHTYDRDDNGDEMWNEIVENKVWLEKAELEDAE